MGDSANAQASRSASQQTYIPMHLGEKILTSKAAIEGERKKVTVLFADLKGSMELVADRDPEDARRLLDSVLEHVMEAVHYYEGTVNQVMGDGIMALFGAPLAHEDHAVRACFAALRMQELVKRHANDVRRAQGVNVQIRVGLNTGEVVVRAISSGLHLDYSAIGRTTHLAARMEQLASPGSILLTASTLDLVHGFVAVKPLGPVAVKGLADAVEVFEVVGVDTVRPRLNVTAPGGLTYFMGRGGELEQLRRVLGRASGGDGQVVAITGEPGVGKSRLIWELAHSHFTHGWRVLHAGAVSYGHARSYVPVIDLLKSYFAVEDVDEPSVVREKLTGKLLKLDRALEDSLPALLTLLDVPSGDPQWPTLDPPQRRRRTLDAVKRLLLRESQEQPLLVNLEDLHWIDSETQALLDELVEASPAAKLLLLISYRPEYQHPWGNRANYTHLRLGPLSPDTVEQLLGKLLGPDGGLDPLKRVLIARTEGNPFFLEESVQILLETGALLGERGSYQLVRPLPTIQIPAKVHAVLAARIDRLRPGDKALLQIASVVGKDVPFVLLQATAQLADDELHAAVGRLQAAEFLYEIITFPGRAYTFKHALTHDVAYDSLLRDRRRMLHRHIAGAIERLYPERLAEHVEQLAYHAFGGDLWEKAVAYLRQAGVKAFARSSNREALAYLEQALTALSHLPETHETRKQAIDIRVDLRNALYPLAEYGRIEGYLREAEYLARALGDQRRLGWALAYTSSLYLTTGGHAAEARTLGQRADAIAEALGDAPLHIAAQYYVAWACYISGDYRRTDEICRNMMRSLQGDRARERFGVVFPAIQSRVYLARTLAECGAFDEGDLHGQEAIDMAEAVDHPFSLSWACLGLAHVHSIRGEQSEAARLLERAVAQCRDWNIGVLTPIVTALMGYVYAWSGRVGEGVSWLQQALMAYESSGMEHFYSISVVQLGEAYLLAARVEDAHACADRAVRLARRRGERGFEAWALRLLGDIASRQDRPDVVAAEAHYGAAMALTSELGMHPLAAHCHLGIGKLYRRPGKREQGRKHLTTATAMYREMNMSFWLQKAEAEIHQPG